MDTIENKERDKEGGIEKSEKIMVKINATYKGITNKTQIWKSNKKSNVCKTARSGWNTTTRMHK